MASCFDHVPVVEVCTDNFTEVWPFMVQAIKKSSFVAVDTVSNWFCIVNEQTFSFIIE